MKRTQGRLADGREIFWYDIKDDRESAPQDQRDLPDRASGPEMRYDPLLDEWVAIASARQGRTHLPPANECPLCPSTEAFDTEIPGGAYDVVVFENRFPSFRGDQPGTKPSRPDDLSVHEAGGRTEVVCFSPEHNASFADLSVEQVRLVVDAWADRTKDLSEHPGVKQVFPFENRGQEVGVTLHHPHGQIYAYPFVPPRSKQHLTNAYYYREDTGRCLFSARLAAEVGSMDRIVERTDAWTAFVPFASRWPLELHIYPNRKLADLTELDDEERDGFADLYRDLLKRLDLIYDAPLPYMMAWHQAPMTSMRDLGYLHLELFTIRRSAEKLKYLASSESAMGSFVNDVAPEAAAELLRSLGART
jgi:UDPglucose--hexose-1-phosphate uridylyltransferase